ncbi:MAG: ATP-binding protein [Methanoregulaceae archaeon]
MRCLEIRDTFSFKNRSFFLHALACMLLLIVILVGYLTASMYLSTKENLERDALRLQQQTEANIREAIVLSDEGYNLFDDSLNSQMKDKFQYFLQEYNRSGRDPAKMNLAAVKSRIGDSYDLYIINSSGVIEYTTYAPELGQDFHAIPYFYEYLTRIRLSGGFYTDHVVRDELGTGKYRKYAYMPTPDHAYVLELGFSGSQILASRADLSPRALILNMTAQNPYVEQVHVYDTMGQALDEPGYSPNRTVTDRLKKVISGRADLEYSDAGSSRMVRYLYLNRESPFYGSDSSRIVEITYNAGRIREALHNLVIFYLAVAVIAIILGCGIAIVLSRHLSHPISTIASDIEAISRGDLERKAGATHIREFRILEQSINAMVCSIKESFAATRDSEEFLRKLLDQLPVAVFVKRVPEGTYLFWNRTCENLFGIPAGEALGKTDREISGLEQIDLFWNRESGREQTELEIRDRIVTSKTLGRRIVHTLITPVKNSRDGTQYLIGIIEDITEANLNRKLNLLSSISRHDILNHLTTIITSIELAEAKDDDPAHQANCKRISESVDAVKREVAFMGMIQGLGVNAPNWQPVKESCLSMIPLLPRKDIEIRADLPEMEIHADALLPKVFYNLMENSEKHGGDTLTVIRLSSREREGSLEILYEDNGSGIPRDEKEKVFQFGYGKGTGLGLFLIREILTSTGITIREEGEPGNGVRFILTVPPGSWRRVP